MIQNLKTKINQVKFLMSPLQKAYYNELLRAGILYDKDKKSLLKIVESILKDEEKIIQDLKKRKIKILHQISGFVTDEYKYLIKKAQEIFEKLMDEQNIQEIETKINNI